MTTRKFARPAAFSLFAGFGVAAWACADSGPAPTVYSTSEDSGSSPTNSDSGSTSGSGSSGGGSSGGSIPDGATGSSSGGSSSGGSDEAGTGCTVTSTGGLPLTGSLQNYLSSAPGITPSYGGFAFALSDSTAEGCGAGADAKACGTSVGCIAKGELCAGGTTGIKNGAITYGAGIGANLAQSSDGGAAAAVTVSSAGLTYAVSSVPPNSMEIEIKVGTTAYCYVTTVASGTIPYASFVEKCTSTPPGAAFAGTSITGVGFQAKAGPTASPYDFCVTSLTF